MLGIIGSIKLVESPNALQEAKLKVPVYFKRSWKERLLSRPWKPWKKYDFFLAKKMEPAAYFMEATTVWGFKQPPVLVYHPALKEQILNMMEAARNPFVDLGLNGEPLFYYK